MEIEKAVVEFATEAALRYRAMAATKLDNEVSESFLRGHVASRLHDRLACPIHVDRLYAAMAVDLGVPVTAELLTAFGGQRADIAAAAGDKETEKKYRSEVVKQWEGLPDGQKSADNLAKAKAALAALDAPAPTPKK